MHQTPGEGRGSRVFTTLHRLDRGSVVVVFWKATAVGASLMSVTVSVYVVVKSGGGQTCRYVALSVPRIPEIRCRRVVFRDIVVFRDGRVGLF
jgi:hypothetical protein